ncbi:hypothetical protein [Pseudomonas massiliensis]|uniref:hypothetical protein n=1 Tax=Pseudomonas massiliensis TaxID=522492 RepID=UPI0011DE00DD|nr:hypothetical protein [Pseudomonas massiliensis]
MLRRLACRTAGRVPAGFPTTGEASTSMFTLPLLGIAVALIGLGVATANALEVVIGGICLVAALSKPSGL